LGLFSGLYLFGLTCRNLLVKTKGLPSKVISVGNITLGGTGKTPAVIAIAEEAAVRGLHPCILTRGYKGKSKGPCLITRDQGAGVRVQGRKDLCRLPPDPLICGDEPALMALRLSDVPIIKCADRYKGGLFAISNLKSQNSNLIFILDDGFQHRALRRDVDILLIDATDPFGNGRLFPEGRLREPLSSIKRAHVIALTKTDLMSEEIVSATTQKVKKYNATAPVFTASHKPTALVDPSGGSIELDILNGRKIYVFSGIANGEYFRKTLTARGADIVRFRSFRDHYIYRQRDMDKIMTEAAGLDIITTEKDLVKIRGLSLPKNLFALSIEFEIDRGFYDYVLR